MRQWDLLTLACRRYLFKNLLTSLPTRLFATNPALVNLYVNLLRMCSHRAYLLRKSICRFLRFSPRNKIVLRYQFLYASDIRTTRKQQALFTVDDIIDFSFFIGASSGTRSELDENRITSLPDGLFFNTTVLPVLYVPRHLLYTSSL